MFHSHDDDLLSFHKRPSLLYASLKIHGKHTIFTVFTDISWNMANNFWCGSQRALNAACKTRKTGTVKKRIVEYDVQIILIKTSSESSAGATMSDVILIRELPDFKESYKREGVSRHINIGWWQNLTFRGHHCSFLGNKSNKSLLFSILISSARALTISWT